MENKEVEIEEDQETFAQLSSRKYFLASNGKLEVENKKEMKKRGLDSPDRADALALSVYLGKIKKYTGSAPNQESSAGSLVRAVTGGTNRRVDICGHNEKERSICHERNSAD